MSETALLTATRNAIRALAEFDNREVRIEFDEQVPAAIAHKYVAVMPGDIRPGPTHNTSGGVIDKVHGIRVMVIIRAVKKPRDRSRDLFLDNTGSMDAFVGLIEGVIDFSDDLRNAANALIVGDGFTENLKWAGYSPLTFVASSMFQGRSGEERAGLKRIIHFGGARIITNR